MSLVPRSKVLALPGCRNEQRLEAHADMYINNNTCKVANNGCLQKHRRIKHIQWTSTVALFLTTVRNCQILER